MANPFVHVELATNDPEQAKKFYSRLFAWELKDIPMGPGETYTMIGVGEGTGGGIMRNPVPGVPSHWLAYVGVEDVAVATAKARTLGAAVLKEKSEVPGYGWFSVIADPTGAVLALWEPARK